MVGFRYFVRVPGKLRHGFNQLRQGCLDNISDCRGSNGNNRSFDLLGFAHVWGRSRRGRWITGQYTQLLHWRIVLCSQPEKIEDLDCFQGSTTAVPPW